MNRISYKQEIEKMASVESTVKGVGKFMSRTATGALLGAGIGGMKGVNANANDPNASQDTKETNIMGGLASGAILGGLAGGVGIGAAKKLGKGVANKLTPGFMKKSEMEVPTEEEKGINNDEAREEVQESPNEKEKSRMRSSIDNYKKEIEKCSMSKIAKYMIDVKCEKCGFDVTPNSNDGRCPQCGALGGVAPKAAPSYTRSAPLITRDQLMGRLTDEIYSARQNFYNMY